MILLFDCCSDFDEKVLIFILRFSLRFESVRQFHLGFGPIKGIGESSSWVFSIKKKASYFRVLNHTY